MLGSAISGFTVSPYSPCCFQEYGKYSNLPKLLRDQVLQNFTFAHSRKILCEIYRFELFLRVRRTGVNRSSHLHGKT